MEPELVLTADLDWAPDAVLAHMLELLEPFGVPLSLFCTHPTALAAGLDVGIHPNLLQTLEPRPVVEELLAAYPEARGIRCHALLHSSRLSTLYRELGLEYTSNYLCPGRVVGPLHAMAGLTEVPIYLEDDHYFSVHQEFSAEAIDLDSPGLRVLNFHPVHVFLNTPGPELWDRAKVDYHKPERLARHRWKGRGTATLLLELLERARRRGLRFSSLRTVVDRWRSTAGAPFGGATD